MSAVIVGVPKQRARYLVAAIASAGVALALSGCQSATSASADERAATAEEIRAVAVGRTLSGGMTYNADGSYRYQGRDPGRYTISDGQVCVAFDNGRSRCDRIVTTDGSTYTMINQGGRRFPFG